MRKDRPYICTFPTGINGIDLEPADFINIRHPLLEGVFGSSMVSKKWEVLEPVTAPNARGSKHVPLKLIEVPTIGAPPRTHKYMLIDAYSER